MFKTETHEISAHSGVDVFEEEGFALGDQDEGTARQVAVFIRFGAGRDRQRGGREAANVLHHPPQEAHFRTVREPGNQLEKNKLSIFYTPQNVNCLLASCDDVEHKFNHIHNSKLSEEFKYSASTSVTSATSTHQAL